MAKKKTLTFRMHGLATDRNSVAAGEFARKLGALVRGLKKADKLGHGRHCLDFLIIDLRMGSAQAQITEAQAHVKHSPHASGIERFYLALRAISEEAGPSKLNGSSELLGEMRSLSLNASKKFSHIDFFVDDEESEAIRIDSFFANQVLRTARALKTAEEKARQRLFKGRSRVSFDGTLKVVDHRGAKKLGLLVLTAGGAEIECIYDEKIAAKIGSHFDTRCRVEAWAYYDGKSKLPIRLELTDARPLKADASLKKWRGAFEIPDEDFEEWAE